MEISFLLSGRPIKVTIKEEIKEEDFKSDIIILSLYFHYKNLILLDFYTFILSPKFICD